VKPLSGQTFYITMSATDTVYDLRAKLEDKHGLTPDQTRLICAGRCMEDCKRLVDYGVNAGQQATVHYVLRLRSSG